MRNQTNNVFKVKRQKSKLFLIILCVFGLLFSWSCSCKNRVSNPDDTPTDGGITPQPTNYIPKTYEATRSGDTLILVSSDGASVTPASISFKDATVTSVSVDVGATGINEAFKYENGGLTMTAFEGVTTTRQTVTATFNLAPNDSRDTLSNPTETVSIEVAKSKGAFDKATVIGTPIKDIFTINMSKTTFQFRNNPETDRIVVIVGFMEGVTGLVDKINKNTFIETLRTQVQEKVTDATSIEFVNDSLDSANKTHIFNFKFKFPFGYSEYEQTEDQLQNGITYAVEVKTEGDKNNSIIFVL